MPDGWRTQTPPVGLGSGKASHSEFPGNGDNKFAAPLSIHVLYWTQADDTIHTAAYQWSEMLININHWPTARQFGMQRFQNILVKKVTDLAAGARSLRTQFCGDIAHLPCHLTRLVTRSRGSDLNSPAFTVPMLQFKKKIDYSHQTLTSAVDREAEEIKTRPTSIHPIQTGLLTYSDCKGTGTMGLSFPFSLPWRLLSLLSRQEFKGLRATESESW